MADAFPTRLFERMPEVWKYTLEMEAVTRVDVAGWDRQVLHVHEQGGEVCVWLSVFDYGETRPAFFRVIGTGWAEPQGARYVGTAHVGAGVWHVYLLDREPVP